MAPRPDLRAKSPHELAQEAEPLGGLGVRAVALLAELGARARQEGHSGRGAARLGGVSPSLWTHWIAGRVWPGSLRLARAGAAHGLYLVWTTEAPAQEARQAEPPHAEPWWRGRSAQRGRDVPTLEVDAGLFLVALMGAELRYRRERARLSLEAVAGPGGRKARALAEHGDVPGVRLREADSDEVREEGARGTSLLLLARAGQAYGLVPAWQAASSSWRVPPWVREHPRGYVPAPLRTPKRRPLRS